MSGLLLVSLMRPLEMGNDSLMILGGCDAENQASIERVIDETGVLEALASLPQRLDPYLLMDGGGIKKFAKSRTKCDFCNIPLSVINVDTETTTKHLLTATSESLSMLTTSKPSHIVNGLLHGLSTILLRLRKCGLSDGERTTFDSWYQKLFGTPIVKNRSTKPKADGSARTGDGKLDIEQLDRVLGPAWPSPEGEQPGKKRRKPVPDPLLPALAVLPHRWHDTMKDIRTLRYAKVLPNASVVLGRIHAAFVRHTPDGTGWGLGPHFVAHAVHFAQRHAGGDLRYLHEQLVERQNQVVKGKLRHWSGDVCRSIRAHNSCLMQGVVVGPVLTA